MTEKAKPRLVFNDTILRAYRRVDDLEEKLAALLIPILDGAADEAARNFAARATDPLTAAVKPRQSFSADAGDDAGLPTMVALLPHPDESRSLAEPGGHDPVNLHVTLAYLGKTTGPLDAVRDALIPVAAAHAPLAGQVGGVGQFADNGEGNPAIAIPSVAGLTELRVDVTRALTDAGIEYGRSYGFVPHMTLDYRPDPPGIEHAGKPLTFSSLWVVRGDTERLELSLVGAKPLTASATGVEREIAEVADRHRPDGGYGDAYWEAKAAEDDFLSVDGVKSFAAADWTTTEDPDRARVFWDGDGWVKVYVASRGLTASASWSAPAPDEIIDVEGLVKQLRTKTDPVRMAVVESVMKPVLDHAGISFDATNPLTAGVLAQSGSHVTGIAQTTQVNVMRAVRHGYEQGLSIHDTAKAIRAGMKEASPARARLIARTELAGAANGGSLASVKIVNEAQQAEGGGGNFFKQWLTAPGAQFPRHEDYDGLDGQTVRLDDTFTVGEDQLQYPGDPDGSPDEVCNCRCALAYTEDASELSDSAGGVDGGTAADDETDAGGEDVPQTDALPDIPAEAPPVESLTAGDNVSVPGEPPVPPEFVQTINEKNLLGYANPTPGLTDRVLGDFKDTESKFKLPDGSYTPERELLHDQIVAAHFENRLPTVGRPVAYFTAGGGASGKSGALFRVGDRLIRADELEAKTPDVVIINPDDVKEMLPEYKQLQELNDPYAASAVHEESSDLAKRINAEAIRRGQSYLLDTTGQGAKFGGKIADAAAANYETQVTLVSIPTNLAVERSIIRGDRNGRYVSINALKDAHSGSSAAIDVWRGADYVNEWRVYDNTQGLDLVAEKTADGRTVIYDQERFDEIRAKGAQGNTAPAVLTTPETTATPPTGHQVEIAASTEDAAAQALAAVAPEDADYTSYWHDDKSAKKLQSFLRGGKDANIAPYKDTTGLPVLKASEVNDLLLRHVVEVPPVTVHSGGFALRTDRIVEGNTVSFKTWTACSPFERVAAAFGNDIVTIRVPEGSRALLMNALPSYYGGPLQVGEIVFPPGTRFVKAADGTYDVIAG